MSINIIFFNSSYYAGLIIANHQSTSDTIVIDSFAMRLGNAGYLHFFAKDELKYVPLFGVYWHQHGLIFVKKGNNMSLSECDSVRL